MIKPNTNPKKNSGNGSLMAGGFMFVFCASFAIIALVTENPFFWICSVVFGYLCYDLVKPKSDKGQKEPEDSSESKAAFEDSSNRASRNAPLRKGYPMAKETAVNLFNILRELDKNEEMRTVLAESVNINDTSNTMDLSKDSKANRLFPTLDNRLAILALNDIIKCYERLCKSDRIEYKPESLPLAIFLTLVGNGKTDIWDDFDLIQEKNFEIAQGFYDVMKNHFSTATDIGDKLFVIEYLRASDVDEVLAKRYAVALYRFCMAIANADGKVTPEEKEWLSNLLAVTPADEEAVEDKKGPIKTTPSPKPSTGDALKELSSLIGLESVKSEVENIYNLIKIQNVRKAKGMKSSDISYHCVFTGNPGTGKTTVARLVAQIYKDLGILRKGHLVETDRSGLVAEYVGQTAVKTNKIIDSALDGVLFIDEAYSLVQGDKNDYGMEAIATLLKRMEDNRDRLVVILAGYSEEMKQFIDSNPGLKSRFNRYIHFEDYNADDLAKIYRFNLKKYDYRLSDDASVKLRQVLAAAVANKDKNFGNARYVRNLFEKTLENQARRLASVSDLSEDILAEIQAPDIPDCKF